MDVSDEEGLDAPDYRAVVRGSEIRLCAWRPHLIGDGPVGSLVTEAADDEVVIADVAIHKGARDAAEVIVSPAIGGLGESAKASVTLWAASVGYKRLWFPNELIELPQWEPGTARVDCPACGAHWEDDSPEFWNFVREVCAFPVSCLLCGGDLPQWEVAEPIYEAGRTHAVDADGTLSPHPVP
jgi:hypothetical protein